MGERRGWRSWALHWPTETEEASQTMTTAANESTSEQELDLHTTAGKLADLERRLNEAVHAGSEKAIEKQHAKGRKTDRERIEMHLHEGSLDEIGRANH